MNQPMLQRPLLITLASLTVAALACTMPGAENVAATANAAEATLQAAVTQNALPNVQDFEATNVAATVMAINVQQTLNAQGQNQPPVATITAAPPTATVKPATGTITGKVCFPAGGIPPLTIYIKPLIGDVISFENPPDTSIYSIEVPGGNYTAFAYPSTSFDPSDSLAGGYTQAVPCGLQASCTDHTLIEFAVTPGVSTNGIDICDWYAPAGTLPPRP